NSAIWKRPMPLVVAAFLIPLLPSTTCTLAAGTTASFSSTTVPPSLAFANGARPGAWPASSAVCCPRLACVLRRRTQRDKRGRLIEELREVLLTAFPALLIGSLLASILLPSGSRASFLRQ